jgi:sugar fermentation stimulation protein A
MATSYLLFVLCDSKKTIRIGSIGTIDFEEGVYVYVGSANLENPMSRVLRHFRNIKSLRWHIDYLTSSCKILGALVCEGLSEEEAYEDVSKLQLLSPHALGFGSTDFRGHMTHLFKIVSYSRDPLDEVRNTLVEKWVCGKVSVIRNNIA